MRSSGLVLFVCAGMLLSGGAILGGSTAWSLLRMSYYFWTSDLGVELGSTVLFVAGSLLCLPTCWLATLVPYHPRSLAMLGTLMFLTTAAMVLLSAGMISLTGLSSAVREPSILNTSMLRAMSYEETNSAVRSAFASMQLEMRCCGVQSYADWYKHRRTLPPSCCNRVWNGKRGDQCETPVHTSGCLRTAIMELRAYTNSILALASPIIIIMAVTLFAAAYTLVSGVIEKTSGQKPQLPVRITCLHTPAPQASLVSFTSPAVVPNQHPAM